VALDEPSLPTKTGPMRIQVQGIRRHLAVAFFLLALVTLIGFDRPLVVGQSSAVPIAGSEAISEVDEVVADAPTLGTGDLPLPNEPVATLLRGPRMKSRLPIRVYWGAWPHPDVEIDHYILQSSADGGPWRRTKERDAADQGARYKLSFGKDYRFRLRAVDASGSHSPWIVSSVPTRLRRLDDRNPAITRTGDWHERTNAAAYRHTLLGSGVAGDSLALSFTGRAIGIVAPASHRQRNVDVYVDGVLATTLRVHTINPPASRKVVFTMGGFGDGETHQIEIRVLDGRRPRFRLDAFVVLK
jgi:hypothetical protein